MPPFLPPSTCGAYSHGSSINDAAEHRVVPLPHAFWHSVCFVYRLWNVQRLSLEGLDALTDDAFTFNWDVDPRALAKQSFLSCLTVRCCAFVWTCYPEPTCTTSNTRARKLLSSAECHLHCLLSPSSPRPLTQYLLLWHRCGLPVHLFLCCSEMPALCLCRRLVPFAGSEARGLPAHW